MSRFHLITTLFVLALTAAPVAAATEAQTDSELDRAQYRWAINWINGPLESLMAHGIIESIDRDDSTLKILAGDAWSRLSFKQAGELLEKLSRARQITGHPPSLTVEQSSTGAIVGRVAWNSIEVLVPGEGYREYFPDTPGLENTAY